MSTPTLNVTHSGRPTLTGTADSLSIRATLEARPTLQVTAQGQTIELQLQPTRAVLRGTPGASASLLAQAEDRRLSVSAPGSLGSSGSLSEILSDAGVTPAADGQYTVGLGVTQDGKITIQNGIITAVQQALP